MPKPKLHRVVAASLMLAVLLPSLGHAQSAKPDARENQQGPAATAATSSAAAKAPQKSTAKAKLHKLAIQIDENRPEVMNLALNNARNVIEHYKLKGEAVAIEIVTFGPGLHMLRDDTSPVKQRITELSLAEPSVTFVACANTQANHTKQEQKPITLISESKLQPSGVVRLMELQKQGYAYIRP
jgi:intracellular sulfur oxidation DsrE/DsrF family protein